MKCMTTRKNEENCIQKKYSYKYKSKMEEPKTEKWNIAIILDYIELVRYSIQTILSDYAKINKYRYI